MVENSNVKVNSCNKLSCFDNLQSCSVLPRITNTSALYCDQSIASGYPENFNYEFQKISSEKDAEDFLDEINWGGFSFFPLGYETNFSSSFSNYLYYYDVETEDYTNLDFCIVANNCTDVSSADVILSTTIPNFIKYLFFVLGFFNILGNLFVIVKTSKHLTSSKRYLKEKTIFNLLTLNLAMADILTGIDVTIYAFYLANLGTNLGSGHIEISFCHLLGILGFVSNQVSIFVLVLISAVRLYSIVRPFKPIKIKFIVGLLILIWSSWLISGLIPLWNVIDAMSFTGVRSFKNATTDISFASVKRLFKNLSKQRNLTAPCELTIKLIETYDSPTILVKTLEKLHLIDSNYTQLIGFYNKRNLMCIVHPLVEFGDPGSILVLLILLLDLLCFGFISVAYAVIIKKMQLKKKGFTEMFKLSVSQTTHYYTNRKKANENQKMYRSILFIIISDLIVWIPMLILSFVYFFLSKTNSCQSSQVFQDKESLYVFCIIFLLVSLPINSTINPYFYSIQAWKQMAKDFKQKTTNLTSFSKSVELL